MGREIAYGATGSFTRKDIAEDVCVANRNLKGVIKSSSTSDIQECWAQAGTQSDQWGKINDLERPIYWRDISEYLRGKW